MKIRTDFVTNSSSTSYLVILEKLGTNAEIRKELETAFGFGPVGTRLLLKRLSPLTDEHDDFLKYHGLDLDEIKTRRNNYFKVSITSGKASDEDWWDVKDGLMSLGNHICDYVFQLEEIEMLKSMRVIFKGERHES